MLSCDLGPVGYSFRGKTHQIRADLTRLEDGEGPRWMLTVSSDRHQSTIILSDEGLLALEAILQVASMQLQEQRYETKNTQK